VGADCICGIDPVTSGSHWGAACGGAAITVGLVDAIFIFDFQAASLTQSGKYRYLEPDAVGELAGPQARLFNGGGMISQVLATKDPDKARAIQRALAKAIEFIRSHPAEARKELAAILNAQLSDPSNVRLDEFTLPDAAIRSSASSTYLLMTRNGLTNGGVDVSTLF